MNRTINATSDSVDRFSFSNFLLSHKDDVALAFSALAYSASFAALMFSNRTETSEIGVSMPEDALLTRLCGYIALQIISERGWYLPKSGALPDNLVKLIEEIAATIETEWLTMQMMGRKLGSVSTYLHELNLNDFLGQAGLQRMLDLAMEYLDSMTTREQIERLLNQMLPETMSHIYGEIKRLCSESIGTRLAANLRSCLGELQNWPWIRAAIEKWDSQVR